MFEPGFCGKGQSLVGWRSQRPHQNPSSKNLEVGGGLRTRTTSFHPNGWPSVVSSPPSITMFFQSAKRNRRESMNSSLKAQSAEIPSSNHFSAADMPRNSSRRQSLGLAPHPQHPQHSEETNKTTVAMTNDQFDQFMSFVKQTMEERKHVPSDQRPSNGSLGEVEKRSSNQNNGMVTIGDALSMIPPTALDDGVSHTIKEKDEEQSRAREIVPDTTSGFSSEPRRNWSLLPSEGALTRRERSHSLEKTLSRTEMMRRSMFDAPNAVSFLNKDTFSFLISAPVQSAPFLTGIFVFLLKTLFYFLTLADLMNLTNGGDVAAKIPAGLNSLVFYTQFFSLLVAIVSQNDIIVSLKLAYEGYGGEHGGVQEAFPESTFAKWLVVVILMLMTGMAGLLATLYLIITSSTILDVLLNFAAVEFISSLDDAAFFLASIGYLGKGNLRETHIIAETVYEIPRKIKPCHQVFLLSSMITLTICSWITVAILQLQGAFAPGSVFVQFDDSFGKGLDLHSGIYVLASPPLSATDFLRNRGRFRYTEQSSAGGGKFDYCHGLGAWTFFIEGNDPCANTLAMAKPLDTFDIAEAGRVTWLILKDDAKSFVPSQNFFLSTICSADDDCSGGKGVCNSDGMCDCDPGFFGPRCDFNFDELCPLLTLNELAAQEFLARRRLAASYELLKDQQTNEPLSIYERPVYYNNETQDTILYTGLRWVIMNPLHGGVKSLRGRLDNQTIMDALTSPNFHASITIGFVDAASSPVYYNSAQESSFPGRHSWFAVLNSATDLQATVFAPDPLPVSLICAQCDNSLHTCFNDNKCVNGTCQCQYGETGVRCQVLPTGDGQCNSFFNTPAYDYDLGDCCGATCREGRHPCGSLSSGENTIFGVGYPNCINPSLVSHCLDGQACYVRDAGTLNSFSPSAGSTSFAGLWSNGQVMVVAERGVISTLRIARDTRGVPVEAVELGPATVRVALVSPPGNIVGTNIGSIPRGLILYNRGNAFIETPLLGSVTPTLTSQSPISLDTVIQTTTVSCTDILRLDAASLFFLDVGRPSILVTVAVVLADTCPNNVTLPENNTHVFWSSTRSAGWQHIALAGISDDVSLSGNSLYMAQYDGRAGVGENIRVLIGAVDDTAGALFADPITLVRFSLRESLARLLDINSTVFTSLDAMQMSYNGLEISIAASALNTNTQEAFGVVVKIELATGLSNSPVVRNPVVPVAYLDSFPPFVGHGDGGDDAECVTSGECDTVVFSRDGSSFAFLSHTPTDEDKIDVYTTERNYGLQCGQWKYLASFWASDHEGIQTVQKFHLSHDGSVLSVGSARGVDKFNLREPCRANEKPLYLSLSLDNQPASVSWRIEYLFRMNGMTYTRSILRDCTGCYTRGHFYAQHTALEKICVPLEMLRCLGVRLEIAVPTTGTIAVAFFEKDTATNNVINFQPSDETANVGNENGFVSVWRNDTCPNTSVRACSDGESLLVQTITFDQLDGAMVWMIRSNTTGTFTRTITRTDVNPVDSTVHDEFCVPSSDCWVLSYAGNSFGLSYLMTIFGGVELPGSGQMRDKVMPTFSLGTC